MGSRGRDTRDGLFVGFIAYAAVAVFYSLFDLLATRGSLYTVNLLGRTVFRGLRDPSVLQFPVQLDTTAIGLYNAVHLVTSLVIGIVVMAFVGIAERDRSKGPAMAFVIATGFVVTIVAVAWLSTPIREVLPFWSIVAANTAAVIPAAIFVMRRRPGVLGQLLPFLKAA